MRRAVLSFLRDESGATAIEYSLMIALVGVAVISALDLAGDAVAGVFQSLSLELSVAGEDSAVPDTGSGDSGPGDSGPGESGAGESGAGESGAGGSAHGEEAGDD